MRKKINLMILLGIMCLCFNISAVNAADKCSCYYASNTCSGDNTIEKESGQAFAAKVTYSKTKPSTLEFCQALTNKCYVVGTKLSKNISEVKNEKATKKKIIDANCSVSACATMKLHYNHSISGSTDTRVVSTKASNGKQTGAGTDVRINGGGKYFTCSLKAIEKDKYDKILTSDSAKREIIDSTSVAPSLEDIKAWGGTENSSVYDENSLNVCDDVIESDLKKLINDALAVISLVGIILLIVMSMIEFIKAITGANDGLIVPALKHTLIRILCAIILLILPMLISGLITMVNNAHGPLTDENGNVIYDANGDPLCGVG